MEEERLRKEEQNQEQEKRWCIYIHINKVNGKVYIGQTGSKPEKRWANGKGYRSGHLHNAINKYGWNNFIHIVIYDNLTLEEANFLEIALIAKCDAMNRQKGYNETSGGKNCVMSEEAKSNISKHHANFKGENHPQYGTHRSPELRAKISKTLTGKYAGEKHPMYGKHHTEETRKKISENHADFSNGKHPMYGKHHTEESKRHMSEAKKGRYCGENNPWYGHHPTEETRKLMREHHWDNTGANNPNFGRKGSAHQTAKAVNQYTRDGEFIRRWDCITDAQRELGIFGSNITACCRGKQKTAGGYIWKYADSTEEEFMEMIK